jgi:hypothetical protein
MARQLGAAEADRGAVIMKLGELYAEALPDRHDDIGEQRCAVGIKQPVESAPNAIVT